MKKQEDKKRKVKTPPTYNQWEPVPGQALVAEEIARRIEADKREKKLFKKAVKTKTK